MREVLWWLRTFTSAVCLVLAALSVLALCMAAYASTFDPDVMTWRLLANCGGTLAGSLLVAWLLRRRRDRGVLVEVLGTRGELPDDDVMAVADACEGEPTQPLSSPYVLRTWPPHRDGMGYEWPEAKIAALTRKLVERDRMCGPPAIPMSRDYVHLSEVEYGLWVEIVRAEFRPVPVVPGNKIEEQR